MTHRDDRQEPDGNKELERLASQPQQGLGRELYDLMRHNRKWWLIPAILVLLAAGLLVLLAGTGAAPFLYPIF